jgi:hypothetical protein
MHSGHTWGPVAGAPLVVCVHTPVQCWPLHFLGSPAIFCGLFVTSVSLCVDWLLAKAFLAQLPMDQTITPQIGCFETTLPACAGTKLVTTYFLPSHNYPLPVFAGYFLI